jgi:hypothetical protein
MLWESYDRPPSMNGSAVPLNESGEGDLSDSTKFPQAVG